MRTGGSAAPPSPAGSSPTNHGRGDWAISRNNHKWEVLLRLVDEHIYIDCAQHTGFFSRVCPQPCQGVLQGWGPGLGPKLVVSRFADDGHECAFHVSFHTEISVVDSEGSDQGVGLAA